MKVLPLDHSRLFEHFEGKIQVKENKNKMSNKCENDNLNFEVQIVALIFL